MLGQLHFNLRHYGHFEPKGKITVIPAKAGIHDAKGQLISRHRRPLDSRFRGNDGNRPGMTETGRE